ncbi:hypothetical protein [Salinarchaeum laminariae]|uniref:hypothetical protein n=1 Tax=Salinarchaeum laminariae TaxID=869888 RepID=UPI0020BEA3C2|nr:hypothetical protein [Salinarchaeum laminariae]
MSDCDSNLEVKVVRKLASNKVTGQHKKQISTVQGWGFASHNKGKVGNVLENLARDPEAPVEMYGGRDVVRLTSLEDAKDFIEERGGDPPWFLQD